MTDPGGIDLLNAQAEELAPCGEPMPSGPLEYSNVVWEKMSPAQREAYERKHGVKPPGYRGTGPVEWFARRHPDCGKCVSCGLVTDHWELRATYIGTGGIPNPTYYNHALCGVMVPFCEGCQRLASILVLELRQLNLTILESVRAGEAVYLAQLRAEQATVEVA